MHSEKGHVMQKIFEAILIAAGVVGASLIVPAPEARPQSYRSPATGNKGSGSWPVTPDSSGVLPARLSADVVAGNKGSGLSADVAAGLAEVPAEW